MMSQRLYDWAGPLDLSLVLSIFMQNLQASSQKIDGQHSLRSTARLLET